MLDRLLNQVNVLEKGLDASWLKNDVIAGNIANADTPDYKARSVSFESVFQDALEPQVVINSDSILRMDGNNVDLEYEMTELAKNSILYDTLTYAANQELGRLKLIISEGK